MRNLNEFIARKAIAKIIAQALLDETSILSCMIYVDLNPIRAKMTNPLLDSEFTSIQERIKQYQLFQKQCRSKNSKPNKKT